LCVCIHIVTSSMLPRRNRCGCEYFAGDPKLNHISCRDRASVHRHFKFRKHHLRSFFSHFGGLLRVAVLDGLHDQTRRVVDHPCISRLDGLQLHLIVDVDDFAGGRRKHRQRGSRLVTECQPHRQDIHIHLDGRDISCVCDGDCSSKEDPIGLRNH